MSRCRRSEGVVAAGLREGGVRHLHDPRGARLRPSLPALLSVNSDSGHPGVFFRMRRRRRRPQTAFDGILDGAEAKVRNRLPSP
jgi:hypothetical protein